MAKVNGTTNRDLARNITQLTDNDIIQTNVRISINISYIDPETGGQPSGAQSIAWLYNIATGIVVSGDTTGTGFIDVTDLSTVQEELVEKTELKGLYKEAADMDRSGEIDIVDLSQLQEYIVNN